MKREASRFIGWLLKKFLKKGPGHRAFLAKAKRLVSKRRRASDRQEIIFQETEQS